MKLNNLIEDNVVREDCNYILKKTNINKFKNFNTWWKRIYSNLYTGSFRVN